MSPMITISGIPPRRPLLCCWALALALSSAYGAEPETDAELAAARTAELKIHKEQIVPFITTYCNKCHGEQKKKGGVTFQYAAKNPGATSFRPLWQQAVANIKSHDMPPDKEQKQPTAQEHQVFM